uniref:Uncharacterized protein n=1 Tax=Monodopsis sp. MarTras21 TaxID=1745953 RepID=A0A1D8RDC3_9STRA|nr:hypothetical protein [Monodopsis sp. MarTras21]
MNTIIFLDEIIKQDKEKFKSLNKTINLLNNPNDEISFAIEYNNLSKVYENILIKTASNKQLPADLKINNWTNLELARIYFLIKITDKFEQEYEYIIENLFKTADINELVALYKSFPYLPQPQKFLFRAQEGARSNINLLFDAIALNNPYPMNFFNENSWNQLILKAFFIESDVKQIIGIERRANSSLVTLLTDFASEKSAAGRTVDPELWNLIKISQNVES